MPNASAGTQQQARTPVVTEARAPEQAHEITIVVSKGSLDMAYPVFLIGNTAAASGYDVNLFFTFWGLDIIHKDRVDHLRATPVGNPAVHMPPDMKIPPGKTPDDMLTDMMGNLMAEAKVGTVHDLLKQAKELGVHVYACSTAMAVLGVKAEDLLPEVDDIVGVSAMLGFSEGGQIIFI